MYVCDIKLILLNLHSEERNEVGMGDYILKLPLHDFSNPNISVKILGL